MPDFTNKIIAISGAASGIGLATAEYLYALGASISITDIRKEALLEALKSITAGEQKTYEVDTSKPFANTQEISSASNLDSGDAVLDTGNERILAIVTDVRNSAQVDQWIASTVEKFGRLDGAANLAGVVGRSIGQGTILDLSDADWAFVNGINLTGVFYCLRAQIRAMFHGNGGGGSIVNAASTAGLEGSASNCDYSASKHGVVGLTRSMAKEWGHLNIRCNAIAPGPIATPMLQTLPENMHAGLEFMVNHTQALHRMGQPIEVARLIGFLLSEESSYSTGGVFVVDGGHMC